MKRNFSGCFQKLLEDHLKNHILEFSDIENYIKNRCASILINPIDGLSIRRKLSKSELRDKIEDLYYISKNEAKSPNRWDVLVYKGLLKQSVFLFIFSEIQKKYP